VRVTRKVIIREPGQSEGERICCAWEDCERDGVQLHRVRVRYHKAGLDPRIAGRHGDRTVWYCFCSERHKMLWVSAHRYGQGRLAPGWRGTIL
jgi:hypothetical protein